ncbi:MAG: hypothetical protein Rubg2KO_19790 [Rubricoccaceae bacterium]
MRNRSDEATRQRLRCEFREIPAHHRITRIKMHNISQSSTWATVDYLQVTFEWGENAPDRVELMWPGLHPSEFLSRSEVATLYTNVHSFLREHDGNY